MQNIELDSTTLLRAEDAFRAWTDPEAMATWWWPMFPDTTYELDPREGGKFRIESAEAGFGVRGTYIEVAPNERLGFTWVWITDGQDADVTDRVLVAFTRDGDATQVHLSHECADDDFEPLMEGWQDVLARLATLTEV